MRVKVCSDFHSEFWNFNNFERILNNILPPTDEDKETILCLAGDCGVLEKYASTIKPLFNLLSERFQYVMTCYGNHEYYHGNMWGVEKLFWRGKKLPKNVFILDDQYKIIDDVIFIGSTLWTDFDNENFSAMQIAQKSMNDFILIRKPSVELVSNKLTPEDTVEKHRKSVRFIFNTLEQFKDMKSVVITHHLPSQQCVDPIFKGDKLNPAFASELGNKIADMGKPDYWQFGHTHSVYQGEIGNTKLVCNPYGYKDVDCCKKFNPNLIIEI